MLKRKRKRETIPNERPKYTFIPSYAKLKVNGLRIPTPFCPFKKKNMLE